MSDVLDIVVILLRARRTPSPAREPAASSAAPVAAPAPAAPAVEEVKELSADAIALRSKNLVEEYLTNGDEKELFLSLQVPPHYGAKTLSRHFVLC